MSIGQCGQAEQAVGQQSPGKVTGVAPPRQIGCAHLMLMQPDPPPDPALLAPALLAPALFAPALFAPALFAPALLAPALYAPLEPATNGAAPPRPVLGAPPMLPLPATSSS